MSPGFLVFSLLSVICLYKLHKIPRTFLFIRYFLLLSASIQSSQYSSSFFHSSTQTISNSNPKPKPNCVRFRSLRPTAAASSSYTSETASPPPSSYSSSKMATSCLYQVLGIPTGASCEEIKAAYRRLARVCHPDVVKMDHKDTSANTFMKIHSAYSTLSDPQKRADYDRTQLFTRRQRPYYANSSSSTSNSGGGGYTYATGYSTSSTTNRWTWETDQCW